MTKEFPGIFVQYGKPPKRVQPVIMRTLKKNFLVEAPIISKNLTLKAGEREEKLNKNFSGSLTTQIRNFAKSLEGQMRKAMHGAPDAIQKKKLVAIRMLAHTLRRYTSLNHLASAARGVLQKPDQIQQMFQDFNRVDITNVQDQAGLFFQLFYS